MAINDGELLWAPDTDVFGQTRLAQFMTWLDDYQGLRFEDYNSLWKWSTENLEQFWDAIRVFFDVAMEGDPLPALESRSMPGARWFPQASLNYADQVFRHRKLSTPALIARAEDGSTRSLSWTDLERSTAALAASLRALGVQRGDRVAAYLPNTPESVIGFLACASIGAIWSCCAVEMGVSVVLDRFSQIKPVILIAADSYSYHGRFLDRTACVADMLGSLPSVRNVIRIPGPMPSTLEWRDELSWESVLANDVALVTEAVPFDHPLWIVYSSGTTGLPKAIVHGHGGIILTHLKTAQLQHDLRQGDCMLFLGSTGWIVWNFMVGGLLSGVTVILNDGDPSWPDSKALWRFIADERVTLFGCGAAYLHQCQKAGLAPREWSDLSALRAINSTGSPLSLAGYEWVYNNVKADVWLGSISGGTDVASGIVACSPGLPVHAGEIQCVELGVAAYAFDESGVAVVDQIGELVITEPMPSMPLFFWNDPGNQRFKDAYFSRYEGVWRQGDWIRFTERGSAVLYGRSDTTMNRQGVRIGPGEIYRVLEEMPEIADSLVVDLEFRERSSFMPLFVVPTQGVELDDKLRDQIRNELRNKASPRHVPNAIYQLEQVPRTLTGKKMELPIRKILLGAEPAEVVSSDAMSNPASLEFFISLARQLHAAHEDGVAMAP